VGEVPKQKLAHTVCSLSCIRCLHLEQCVNIYEIGPIGQQGLVTMCGRVVEMHLVVGGVIPCCTSRGQKVGRELRTLVPKIWEASISNVKHCSIIHSRSKRLHSHTHLRVRHQAGSQERTVRVGDVGGWVLLLVLSELGELRRQQGVLAMNVLTEGATEVIYH